VFTVEFLRLTDTALVDGGQTRAGAALERLLVLSRFGQIKTVSDGGLMAGRPLNICGVVGEFFAAQFGGHSVAGFELESVGVRVALGLAMGYGCNRFLALSFVVGDLFDDVLLLELIVHDRVDIVGVEASNAVRVVAFLKLLQLVDRRVLHFAANNRALVRSRARHGFEHFLGNFFPLFSSLLSEAVLHFGLHLANLEGIRDASTLRVA